MQHSALLKGILENAEKIRVESGGKHLCASYIVAAICDFCSCDYNNSEMRDEAERFEEERLRYAYNKIIKVRGSIGRIYIHKVSRAPEILDKEFDFAECEKIAEARGKIRLSADIVFLMAIKSIPSLYKLCRPCYREEFSVTDFLRDIDANIYAYTIELIEAVYTRFEKKKELAIYFRDWKPARKFAEPEELKKQFFGMIKTEFSGKILHITIPFFFGDDDLKLSVHKIGDSYHLHDNGGAMNQLEKNVDDQEKYERILKTVCNEQWIEERRVTDCFSQTYSFFRYLHRLVLIANADLFYSRMVKRHYDGFDRYYFKNEEKAEDFDAEELIQKIKKSIGIHYDEHKGILMWSGISYVNSMRNACYLLETLDDNKVKISDGHKGHWEGYILENFEWVCGDIKQYSRLVKKYTKRFGAVFEDEDVYLIDDCENWVQAWMKYINVGILLSELGSCIKLPKKKEKEV